MFYKFVLKRVRTRSLEKPNTPYDRKTPKNVEKHRGKKKNRTKHKILFWEYVVIALRYQIHVCR